MSIDTPQVTAYMEISGGARYASPSDSWSTLANTHRWFAWRSRNYLGSSQMEGSFLGKVLSDGKKGRMGISSGSLSTSKASIPSCHKGDLYI